MKLTIVQTGAVPAPLQPRFKEYRLMFRDMFESAGAQFDFEDVDVEVASALPDPAGLDGVVITGSPAGVYEDHTWLPPLREFIRNAYAAGTPMLGICFGHQIMADALGGDVRKSERGWGMGRHSYVVKQRPAFMADAPETLMVACSHQDQVIAPPDEAEVILASEFAPNAGLLYRNGRALSFQPHPEFDDDYARALVELRRGRAPDAVIEGALTSFATASDSMAMRRYIRQFFEQAR
ncbi:type 1 glutamine amidotransferase [Devosia sp. CAU 1758]